MGVKGRSIYASKLDLTAHGDPTATAHTGAVHHHGIEADNGFNFVFPGQICHSLHHGDGAHSNDKVNFPSLINELLEHVGDKTMVPLATVIGGHKIGRASCRER